MDVGQGEVSPHVADAHVLQQLSDNWFGLSAVGALEVAELDHGDRGIRVATDVVILDVDLQDEVLDEVYVAQERTRTGVRSQQRCASENGDRQQRGDDRSSEGAQLGLG